MAYVQVLPTNSSPYSLRKSEKIPVRRLSNPKRYRDKVLWVDLYEAGTTIATGAHILGETTPSIKHLNPRVQAAMDELESGGGELFDELDDLFASWKAA